MQEYVDKNLVRASTTKMAQSRRKALEKMEIIEKPSLPPTPPRFQFVYTEKPYEKVLEVQNLALTAGEKTLLKSASFTLMRGEKCAVVGDNGTGKSTLVKEIVKNNNTAIRNPITGFHIGVVFALLGSLPVSYNTKGQGAQTGSVLLLRLLNRRLFSVQI